LSEINKNAKNSRLLEGLPQPLTANFNAGSIIGYTVSVSSLAETTNSATISLIKWDWGDDSDFSTTQNAVHIYEYAGTYTIKLTVSDSAGNTAERTSEVTVPADNPPAPSFTNSNAKKTVTFNASLSISKYAPITLLIWNFGDGNITRVITSGANMLQSEVVIVHTYAQSIAYNVTLTVIDDNDAEGSVKREISVTDNE
jgi:PKD repeat protein